VNVLVIGADGFVGKHLVRHLREAGDDVTEAIGPSATASSEQIAVDVRLSESVTSAIASAKPDAIYHLAAVAYGPEATAHLATAVAITVHGTAVLLEAVAGAAHPPIVLITGSSEVYGAPTATPIDETIPPAPVNVYGATKLAQEAVAIAFARSAGIRLVVTRSFNHIGPGQRDSFVIPSFARQLRSIHRGTARPVLRVGNLSPVRDFTDVRDVVRAYRLLVAGGHVGPAVNVASGKGISIGEALRVMIEIAGVNVDVEVDPGRVRADDPPSLIGDPSRLRRLTGWSPSYAIDETLADVWADAQMRW